METLPSAFGGFYCYLVIVPTGCQREERTQRRSYGKIFIGEAQRLQILLLLMLQKLGLSHMAIMTVKEAGNLGLAVGRREKDFGITEHLYHQRKTKGKKVASNFLLLFCFFVLSSQLFVLNLWKPLKLTLEMLSSKTI